MSTTSSSPRCERRRWSGRICTFRSSPATTACCRRWRAATRSTPTCGSSSRSRDFNLTADVIVGFPAEDDAAFEQHARDRRAARLTKMHVFPYSPRPGTGTADDDAVPPAVKKERSARLRALSDEACRAPLASRRSASATSCSSTGRAAATATTTRRGSSTARSASSCASAPPPSPRRGSSLPDDCLFCQLVRRRRPRRAGRRLRRHPGHQPAGRDAPARHPRAPRRHVPRRRRVPARTRRSGCSSSSPRPPSDAGLDDYRVLVNVGPGGGQTVFHLHWHVLGWQDPAGCRLERDAVSLIARDRGASSKEAMLARDADASRRAAPDPRQPAVRGEGAAAAAAEDEELQVLQRERKSGSRRPTRFAPAGREEQAEKEEAELDVLEEFMPEPLVGGRARGDRRRRRSPRSARRACATSAA